MDFTLVATGSPPATFTQAMSGQVDVGWAAPPFGVEALQQGKIRFVFRGSEVPAIRDQTVRVLITNAADAGADTRTLIGRFMDAYRETLTWMYTSPDAIHVPMRSMPACPNAIAREHAQGILPEGNAGAGHDHPACRR